MHPLSHLLSTTVACVLLLLAATAAISASASPPTFSTQWSIQADTASGEKIRAVVQDTKGAFVYVLKTTSTTAASLQKFDAYHNSGTPSPIWQTDMVAAMGCNVGHGSSAYKMWFADSDIAASSGHSTIVLQCINTVGGVNADSGKLTWSQSWNNPPSADASFGTVDSRSLYTLIKDSSSSSPSVGLQLASIDLFSGVNNWKNRSFEFQTIVACEKAGLVVVLDGKFGVGWVRAHSMATGIPAWEIRSPSAVAFGGVAVSDALGVIAFPMDSAFSSVGFFDLSSAAPIGNPFPISTASLGFLRSLRISESSKQLYLVGIIGVAAIDISLPARKGGFSKAKWTTSFDPMRFQITDAQVPAHAPVWPPGKNSNNNKNARFDTLWCEDGVNGTVSVLSASDGKMLTIVRWKCGTDFANQYVCDFPRGKGLAAAITANTSSSNNDHLVYTSSRIPNKPLGGSDIVEIVPDLLDISARGKVVLSGGFTFKSAVTVIPPAPKSAIVVYYSSEAVAGFKTFA